ncbi:hypothetical protein [Parapedobacter tibetensis]|uniref:hypothetical protein n=1 Tax=Parapedobacter tibetensis TaxID=2972951 RepID=UPI00214D20EF|nr:hypothetical protein [Parapedobacter tibetensis]
MNIERNEIEWGDSGKVRRIHSRPWLWLRSLWNSWSVRGMWQVYANAFWLLTALSLFLWSGPLLCLWDPTAGVLDIGILSVLPLALLLVVLARLSAAGVYKLMVESFNELTLWQRALCYGCLYLSYFWAVVWVVMKLV